MGPRLRGDDSSGAGVTDFIKTDAFSILQYVF